MAAAGEHAASTPSPLRGECRLCHGFAAGEAARRMVTTACLRGPVALSVCTGIASLPLRFHLSARRPPPWAAFHGAWPK